MRRTTDPRKGHNLDKFLPAKHNHTRFGGDISALLLRHGQRQSAGVTDAPHYVTARRRTQPVKK